MQKLEKNIGRAILCVFAYIPFHAFISTLVISNFGSDSLFKGLKDLVVCLIGLACIFLWYKLRNAKLNKSEKIILSAALSLLALQLLMAVIIQTPKGQLFAGFIINTRFLIFAASVFYITRITTDKMWLKKIVLAILIPLGIVITFGLLQTMLPNDFLRHFGYGENTIMPYQTVDNDESTVRIISTLRGPNPLGAYLAVLMPILLAISVRISPKFGSKFRQTILVSIPSIILAYVLFNTYSRSALIAALIGLMTYFGVAYGRHLRSKIPVLAIGLVVITLGITILSSTPTMQKIILHRDPQETSTLDSDDQRLTSLNNAWSDISSKPFGHGVGSAGLASTYGERPTIIENHFLDIWYQLGVLGLMATLIIFAVTLRLLYEHKSNWLGAAVFAGFIAGLVTSLFWPSYSDETVAYITWGLAGFVVASNNQRVKLKSDEKAQA